MARIRTIKPDFWLSESIARCPHETRLLAIALLNYADDEGYFKAHPALVKAACFPLDDSANIPRMLDELSREGYIRLGKLDDGTSVGEIVNFLEHQRIDKPTKSKIGEKSITWACIWEASANPPGVVDDSSRPEGKGKEGKGTGKGMELAAKPHKPRTRLPADFYPDATGIEKAEKEGVNVATELVKFCDHHRAVGSVMADWQAAWRTWVGNAKRFAPRQSKADVTKAKVAEFTGRKPEMKVING